jgi:signal transduction histidine kinase
LRETQARLKSTLAAGSIGTWTWDIVHDCLIADEFTARMFSIEPDAAAKGLPAEAYLRAVMEEDQPGVADGLARAIQSCGYYDIEYRILRKDREFRWVSSEGEGRGSRHLLQLINDVLDLAKVEAGKIDLNPETFPLAKAIKEVCTVVKGIAQKKGVSVKWAVAPELGNVTLDQQKFKQVCYNLLANAVKFTDSSGSVELNALAHDDERFELRVKEFEQLESGNARRFEGTVLGLALTKKLVESQGGSIGAESEYGKGSTFFVVMPIVFADVKSHE